MSWMKPISAIFSIIIVSASTAFADVNIREIDIQNIGPQERPTVIHVKAEGGRWTRVVSKATGVQMPIKARVKGPRPVMVSRNIDRIVLRERGHYNDYLARIDINPPKRRINKSYWITFNTSRLSQGFRQEAVAGCNQLLPNGGRPDKQHELSHVINIPVRFTVDGRVGALFSDIHDNGDTIAHAKHKSKNIYVLLICEKEPGYVRPHRNSAITALDLKYEVISNANACPVRVRRTITLRANEAGRYRIHLRGGGEKLHEFVISTKRNRRGGYSGRLVDELTMPAANETHRIVAPGTDVKSAPAKLKVDCGRMEILSAKINVKNLNFSGAKSCPMKVRATAVYETTVPGQFNAVIQRSYDNEKIVKTVRSKREGDRYVARFALTERFDDDGVYPVKYRAIAPGKPNLNSPWKDAGVRCPFEVKAAVLSFRQEDKPTCPKKGITRVTFPTTAPGNVRFRFKSENGDLSKWFTAKAKLEDNEYIARYRGTTTYSSPFSATMTVVTSGPHSRESVPSTMKITCGVRSNPG